MIFACLVIPCSLTGDLIMVGRNDGGKKQTNQKTKL